MGRTTIEVLDDDIWNWVKYKKNKAGVGSVSNIVFKLLRQYKEMDLEKIVFLRELEKFFEYNSIGLKELSANLDMNLENVNKSLNRYFGPNFELFTRNNEIKKSNIDSVHRLMVESDLIPRELSISFKLKDFIKKNRLDISRYIDDSKHEIKAISEIEIDNKLILSILFPDPEERHLEIYTETIQLVESLINDRNINKLPCVNCKNHKCKFRDPQYLYYKSGIHGIEKEDIKGDFIYAMLTSKESGIKDNHLACYGFVLAVSIYSLIQKNLKLVDHFIRSEIYYGQKNREMRTLLKLVRKKLKSEIVEKANDERERQEILKIIDLTGQKQKTVAV